LALVVASKTGSDISRKASARIQKPRKQKLKMNTNVEKDENGKLIIRSADSDDEVV